MTHARPRRETVQKIDKILANCPSRAASADHGGELPRPRCRPSMPTGVGLAGAKACEECPGARPGRRSAKLSSFTSSSVVEKTFGLFDPLQFFLKGPTPMPLLSSLIARANRVFAPAATRAAASVRRAALEALEDRRLLSVSVVSVANGSTSLGNNTSREPSVGADGKFVAFSSTASNLVAGDTNNAADVFLRDMSNNTVTLVSVNTGGGVGNAASDEPWIGADGRSSPSAAPPPTCCRRVRTPTGRPTCSCATCRRHHPPRQRRRHRDQRRGQPHDFSAEPFTTPTASSSPTPAAPTTSSPTPTWTATTCRPAAAG